MDNLLDINKIQLFLFIVVPGFISMKVWALLIPSPKIMLKDQIMEAICYSCINFALLFWLINYAVVLEGLFQTILYIVILIIAPIFWPILGLKIISSNCLKGKIIHHIPKAWDYYFNLRKPCFMLIHLKSGKMIGGLYYENSFASSYPEKEDLYIKEVWQIDEIGKFLNKIEGTDGMLISYDTIDYIELFDHK